jgi:hypothetical protein
MPAAAAFPRPPPDPQPRRGDGRGSTGCTSANRDAIPLLDDPEPALPSWGNSGIARSARPGGKAAEGAGAAGAAADPQADRVAVEQGKVAFTARVVKEPQGEDE